MHLSLADREQARADFRGYKIVISWTQWLLTVKNHEWNAYPFSTSHVLIYISYMNFGKEVL